jgi:hypothetical protein
MPFSKGTLLSQILITGDTLNQGQKRTLDGSITECPRRLHDQSWLMGNGSQQTIHTRSVILICQFCFITRSKYSRLRIR